MQTSDFQPWPSFTDEEVDAVSKVLKSNRVNYWTGTVVRQFEKAFATFAGTKYAIALANGTLALDLILHGLGIGAHNGGQETDEVIVTSRSFIASVSSVVNAGAKPVFADLDRNTQNIAADKVAAMTNSRTRAVIAVHLAGWPCDIDAISSAVSGQDVHIIEDCAQAHGAMYKGKPVGGLGSAAAWSFCQDKIMTTGGEGGIVTCNDTDLWNRMWSYKDHGKSYAAVYEKQHAPGFRWLHESFGTNFRMTEMQGAIGEIQLKRMADWTNLREHNAQRIQAALSQFAEDDGPIRFPMMKCEHSADKICCRHAHYKFYMFVKPEKLADGWSRDRIAAEVTQNGVPCMQGSCSEIYLEGAFDGTDLRPKHDMPIAKELGETSLMLLVHPTLSDQNIDDTIKVVSRVLSAAVKAS